MSQKVQQSWRFSRFAAQKRVQNITFSKIENNFSSTVLAKNSISEVKINNFRSSNVRKIGLPHSIK